MAALQREGSAFFGAAPPTWAGSETVIGELLARHPEGVRAWVVGCGTGEEVYSIAMRLREGADTSAIDANLQVFGTDLDEVALDVARRGRYPGRIREELDPESLARFFTRRGAWFTVRKKLRDLCVFSHHDLDADPPFSRMDLVSWHGFARCGEPSLQRRFLEILHYSLRPGGWLLLEEADPVAPFVLDLFERVEGTGRALRRRELAQRRPVPLPRQREGMLRRQPSALPAGPRPGGRPPATNEELLAAGEELESMNEELATVNTELDRRLEELDLLYGDLQNLFESTQIATIFLDREGRIARFTPAAKALFAISEGDVGRPLRDCAARFEAYGVPATVGRVLETLEPAERTVRTLGAGRSYLERVNPYRTRSGAVAGVVLSFTDVTGLKDAEAHLTAAVAERERAERSLRDADHRKDEFLAVLSHELRNPLAPIRNSLHVLESAPAGGEAANGAREILARQVGHLARLVDDLLDVTRVTHGKLQVELRPLDLGALAGRTAEDHRSLFESRGVALEVALPSVPIWVAGDGTRLAQVVGNLLQNAAKFTSRGDLVRLSLDGGDAAAVLRVRDSGTGIAPEVLTRLFEPFSQADDSLDRRQGGLGLGLALAKRLVELHAGTVEVSSGGKGAGTEFVIRLPLVGPPATAATAPTPPAVRARRVLVVEDNVDAAESLRLALELEGHEVAVAHDGFEGLERARALAPDVVVCDIGLPRMDGYELARALRADTDAYLVALSGYGFAEDQRRAAEAGFDLHLTKPATLQQLYDVIATVRRRDPEAKSGRPPPALP